MLRQIAEIERRFGLVRGEATSCRFDQNQSKRSSTAISCRRAAHRVPHAAGRRSTPSAAATNRKATTPSSSCTTTCGEAARGRRCRYLEPALDIWRRATATTSLLDLASNARWRPRASRRPEARVKVLLRQAASSSTCSDVRDEERTRAGRGGALADGPATRAPAREGAANRSAPHWRIGISHNDAAAATLRRGAGAGPRRRRQEAGGAGQRQPRQRPPWRTRPAFAEAQEHYERARALSREIGYRQGEAAPRGTSAWSSSARPRARRGGAGALHESARALFREIGDRQGEAIATGNLGNRLLVTSGATRRRRSTTSATARSAREIGFRQGEAIATGNLGSLFMNLGRYAEAKEHYERARALQPRDRVPPGRSDRHGEPRQLVF